MDWKSIRKILKAGIGTAMPQVTGSDCRWKMDGMGTREDLKGFLRAVEVIRDLWRPGQSWLRRSKIGKAKATQLGKGMGHAQVPG